MPWPIERVEIVNVDEISSFSHKAAMLTRDENIVDVELTVQSRIQDAANYLFQDQAPMKTLRDATETVVRKTIGGSKLDFILTEGRSAVAAMIQEGVQSGLRTRPRLMRTRSSRKPVVRRRAPSLRRRRIATESSRPPKVRRRALARFARSSRRPQRSRASVSISSRSNRCSPAVT